MKIKKINYRNYINNIESSISGPKFIKDMTALIYQENSKFTKYSIIKQSEDIGRFSSPYLLERASQPYKSFPTKRTFSFRDYEDSYRSQMTLFDSIQQRRSGRDFDSYHISMSELYQILHYSYGITAKSPINGINGEWSYRAVPSGGALYPLEIYIYIPDGVIPQGFYHYRPDKFLLELIHEKNCMDDLRKIIIAEPYVNLPKSSCIVFISSILERTLLKYGERGFRFILQEVGFVSQNISLLCEAIGLSSCMIGSYIDSEINKFIQADGTLETIQNIIVIGKEKQIN